MTRRTERVLSDEKNKRGINMTKLSTCADERRKRIEKELGRNKVFHKEKKYLLGNNEKRRKSLDILWIFLCVMRYAWRNLCFDGERVNIFQERTFNFREEKVNIIIPRLYFITQKILRKVIKLCTSHVFKVRGSKRIHLISHFTFYCMLFFATYVVVSVYYHYHYNSFTASDREITFPYFLALCACG